MSALVLTLISLVPQLVNTIEGLIARGRQTGELTTEQADMLTAFAQAQFGKYSQPAPPPPGVIVGDAP